MSMLHSYQPVMRMVMTPLLTAILLLVTALPVLAHHPSEPVNTVHPPAPPFGPPAPLREAIDHHAVQCSVNQQCAGTPPMQQAVAHASALTAKQTRGSNSQVVIPQNLLLADVDADGAADFIQYASNKLFVSKTDFEKTGILHLYMGRPIKRILTGDFHGDHYEQTCVITDDNVLTCYGISTDRHELWWWFTQGTFFADNEDTIVGDFDGDGRDDVLVYPQAGGPFRLYSIKGDFFFSDTPAFNQGNLGGVNTAGLQVRAGDFDGNDRDDVLVVNPAGQILAYFSVNDGANNTFWWGFTTAGLVSGDDQLSVARIDDNAVDDVILHNRVTGTTRFFRLEWAEGVLPAITTVSTGQMAGMGNSLLFWGFMHGALDEPGASTREDVMVYDLNWQQFVRTDARWDGNTLTYWWAYTQDAPNNHSGWAPFTAKPWLMLKCKYADIDTEPQTEQFYRDLNASLISYWLGISYGSWDLSGNSVVDGWQRMSIANEDAAVDRWGRVANCINAFGGSTAGYVNVIAMVNGEADAGMHNGGVLASPSLANVTFLAHETGHTFGWWDHSFNDNPQCGMYCDYWDIMSAMSVYSYAEPKGVIVGPEMNAPYKTKQSFIPEHRILRLPWEAIATGARINIAALNRPEANGPLMVRIGADDNNYYTLEYRMQSGWDQGIPQATVLVHWVDRGVSKLITVGGGPERLIGSATSFWLEGRWFTVRVHNFASQGYTADITVDTSVNATTQMKIYLPMIAR